MATKQQIIQALRVKFPDVIDGLDEVESTQRVLGAVISRTFDDLDHDDRQRKLWAALSEAFTENDLANVRPIVTMTPADAELKSADAD